MTSNTFSVGRPSLAFVVLAVTTVGCGGAGRVEATDAWSRPAAAAGAGVVYLVIHNRSQIDDRLVGATADICDTVELHLTEVVDDRMTMRQLADGAAVAAGATLEFSPGGYHVMLIGLHDPLEVGTRFTLNLDFAVAGAIPLEVEVRR